VTTRRYAPELVRERDGADGQHPDHTEPQGVPSSDNSGKRSAPAEPVGGDKPDVDLLDDDRALQLDLTLLVGEAHAEDARRSRVRERHLLASAAAEATLVGTLLDLAEQDLDVVIRTTTGNTATGRIVLVARDAVAVELAGRPTFAPLGALSTVKLAPGQRRERATRAEPTGRRPAARQITLAALVAELAGDRPRVRTHVAGEPSPLIGSLMSAGTDLLTIRLDGEPAVLAHVALGQLSLLTVLASG